MPSLLEKIKEQLQDAIAKGWIAAITTLIVLIIGYFGPPIIPVLTSIPNNIILALFALSLLFIIFLLFYSFDLSKQLKNLKLENLKAEKFTKGFGILWDKDYDPHCPSCKTMLSNYEEKRIKSRLRGQFMCINCNKPVYLSDQDGFICFDDAIVQLKQGKTGNSISMKLFSTLYSLLSNN